MSSFPQSKKVFHKDYQEQESRLRHDGIAVVDLVTVWDKVKTWRQAVENPVGTVYWIRDRLFCCVLLETGDFWYGPTSKLSLFQV